VLSAVAPGVTADPFGNPVTPVLELNGSAGVMTITDPALIQFIDGVITTGSIKSGSVAQTLQISGPQGISLIGGNVYLGAGNFIFGGQDTGGTGAGAWHTVSPLFFNNGWSGTLKWRFGAENEIKFQCGLSPGTSVDGTSIATINQFPPVTQTHTVWTNALRTGAIGTAAEPAALQLQPAGIITCLGVAAAATSVAGCGFWPMDN
jgi:hypothetical protein